MLDAVVAGDIAAVAKLTNTTTGSTLAPQDMPGARRRPAARRRPCSAWH